MASDTSAVERDRHALIACGAKAAVVRTAAAIPIQVGDKSMSIFVSIRQWRAGAA
jgi:hypothetical protein